MKKESLERIKQLSGLGISKHAAARMLYKEKYYANVESARRAIRAYVHGTHIVKPTVQWNDELPLSEEGGYGVKDVFGKGILMLCDIHLPFQKNDIILHALDNIDDCDTILLQEVFDFYQLSKFDKFRTIAVVQEQDMFFEFMEFLRSQFKGRILFQRGNHDERYQLFFMRKAKEFEGMAGMEFETIFGFDEFDIEMIPLRNLLNYRGLYIGHGHELGRGGIPVSPARTFFMRTGGNFIGGHYHRTSEYIDRNIKDDIIGCWSVGCACDLHPMYAPVNKWNNGYAIIKPFGDNNFRVKNIKIF
jgi:hypothetical protein